MRKLLLTMAALLAVVCGAVNADALDVKDRFMISAGGGVSIPIGDFGDDDLANTDAGGAKPGFNVGASLEYGVAEEFLIGGRFAYNRLSVESSMLGEIAPGLKAHWTVLEIFGLYAKYLVPTGRSTRPYVRGGAFLGKPELTVDSGDEIWSGDYDVSLGVEAALGVTHMISPNVGLGLEACFAHLNTSSDAVPVDEATNRPAGFSGPSGVRDPGGNLQWLAVDGYVTYGF